jgi:hypothetical protein
VALPLRAACSHDDDLLISSRSATVALRRVRLPQSARRNWCSRSAHIGWRSHHSRRFAHLAPKLLHLDSGLDLRGEHAIHHGINVVGCTRDGTEDRTKSIARGSTGHRRVKPLSSSSRRNELRSDRLRRAETILTSLSETVAFVIEIGRTISAS